MTLPYKSKLEHDPQGRISKKTETVAGETVTWTYAYDKAGRLAKCERNGWPVCDCWYDRAGRRACDSFPKSVEGDLRRYEYDMDNRLSLAGKNSYMHDDNGFRSMWNHKGKYTLYEYAPDYRLLKADQKDEGRTYTFRHDEQGRRIAKYCNGELTEAYEWLDFLRLARYWSNGHAYEFAYEDNERTPFAMRRDDGFAAYLFYDQVGSLRVVADTSGNVIKEVQYDPFGGIITDSNPGLRIPIGFAGGLHDRDLGFVRFGFRDYDTYTSRWTAPDPIGDAGGDPDWYGYCLDDPVNGVDPLGLEAKWASRPLDGAELLFGEGVVSLTNKMIGKTSPAAGLVSKALEDAAQQFDDEYNIKFEHRHMFLGDKPQTKVGTSKASEVKDRGFTPDGLTNHEKERERGNYVFDKDSYDEGTMLQAVEDVKGSFQAKDYNLPKNPLKPKKNCQDAETAIKKKYREIWRDQTLEKRKQWFGR